MKPSLLIPSEPNLAQIYKEVFDRLYKREPEELQQRIDAVKNDTQINDSAVNEWVKLVCQLAESKYEAQLKSYYELVQNKVLNNGSAPVV